MGNRRVEMHVLRSLGCALMETGAFDEARSMFAQVLAMLPAAPNERLEGYALGGGGTLTGSLTAFQQYRYLDVFGMGGVKAPAGDLSNVRAEFTQTSGGSANLIGFCTVQDNTSFGADFRIAKSYGSPSSSFFAQGGNAFGATALLGTTDNRPLTVLVNNRPALRIAPAADTNFGYNPNVIGGKRPIRWRPAWRARRLGAAAVAILVRAEIASRFDEPGHRQLRDDRGRLRKHCR